MQFGKIVQEVIFRYAFMYFMKDFRSMEGKHWAGDLIAHYRAVIFIYFYFVINLKRF